MPPSEHGKQGLTRLCPRHLCGEGRVGFLVAVMTRVLSAMLLLLVTVGAVSVALPGVCVAEGMPAAAGGALSAAEKAAAEGGPTREAGSAQTAREGRVIRLGVLAFRGKMRALSRWTPTAHYLSEKIAGHRFQVVPLTLEEMEQAVKSRAIDFMVTNSGNYITLASRYGGSRLVTLNALAASEARNVAGSVIFTRADRYDIRTMQDLRGKSFLSVAPEAFCFQSAWHELKANGIDPRKDFTKLLFAGFPQDYIATAVKKGTVDAGNVRTGVLEAMAAEGKIRLSDFHIISPKPVEGFPFITTTKLYPEWPFVKLKHVDNDLAQQVAIALLQMAPDSEAAVKGGYAGWTVPLDYSPVHDLLRALRMGPYAGLGEITLASVVEQYRSWIVAAALIVLISWLWLLRTERVVASRTRELAAANAALAAQIAERQKAEAESAARQAALEHMSRSNSLGEMASVMAHDLNHPLATILNYVKGCRRKLASKACKPEDLQDIMGQVSDQAQHAADVIQFMVNFLRKDPKPREIVAINAIIHDIVGLLKREMARHGIEINLQLAEGLPPVEVDVVQIEQVLLNLIRNANSAMMESGRERRILTVQSLQVEDQVEVRVIDTGGGFPKDIRARAFEPFTSRTPENLGLGLSICKSVIEKHNGRIEIHSSSPQGSDIRFALPVATVARPQPVSVA